MDPAKEHAYFVAFAPSCKLAFGYVWHRADFPWMGIWEENRSRTNTPWNGVTEARGLEFGVSPMPETRRETIGRNRLFDVPTYRRLPARGRLQVEYWAVLQSAEINPRVPWLAGVTAGKVQAVAAGRFTSRGSPRKTNAHQRLPGSSAELQARCYPHRIGENNPWVVEDFLVLGGGFDIALSSQIVRSGGS
jgi:hypothetical protein